ncbi:carboxymuconolactone decarboxylase family protein [Stakelama tenebrarum]|uniref:Carboxymuconolactone decarboxylase family protein n=1 Tax=Stakelama tenebrarum TaxID=2711215 RepID=A0A6G6Y7M7_9SPHN|nr:carboxymuconolactone decarboxylase family protein [Sphingosinithalassobacter tenebrarum]QIG80851.1 carboxymuconolactone decarboxylase family protein [Sphingosinithalassobacter tenebrarum]
MYGDDPQGKSLIAPVPRAEWTQEMRDFFAISEGEQCRSEGTRFNIQAVMAKHLPLSTAWVRYNRFIARELELADDLREIAILRIAWRIGAGYEYHQHRAIARRCGLSEDKLAAVAEEVSAVWSDGEALIVRAADEMWRDNAASEATMAGLLDRFGEKRTMEVLWTIGTYAALGWIANSMRVPIEDFMLG